MYCSMYSGAIRNQIMESQVGKNGAIGTGWCFDSILENQCLLDLLKDCKLLVGTSANVSGENSFTNSQECFQKIQGFDIFLDGGDIKNGLESTILEMDQGNPIFHRIGALKKEEVIESI